MIFVCNEISKPLKKNGVYMEIHQPYFYEALD